MFKRIGEEWEEVKQSLDENGLLGENKENLLGETREIADRDLQNVLKIVKAEHQDLFKTVLIDVGDPNVDTALKGGPAIFGPEEKVGFVPRIALAPDFEKMSDDSDYFGKLMERRHISIDLLKEQLSRVFVDKDITIDARLLKVIILLHELGHLKHYLENFKKPNVGYVEAFDNRREDYNRQLEHLPVPGVITSVARRAWERSKGNTDEERLISMKKQIVDGYFKLYRQDYYKKIKRGDADYNFSLQEGESVAEFLDRHERLEQETATEKFADDFAVKFLKKHWDELFPEEKHT